MKINRVVEVAPQNHGSRLLKFLSRFKLTAFVLGPIAAEMDPKKIEKLPPLPKDIPTGIILCESKIRRFFEKICRQEMPDYSAAGEKKFEKAAAAVEIDSLKFNVFKDERIIGAVIRFLKTGTF